MKLKQYPNSIAVMDDALNILAWTSEDSDVYRDYVESGRDVLPADPPILTYSEYVNITPVRLVTTNNTPTELTRRTAPQRTLIVAHLELEIIDMTNPGTGVACRHVEASITARRINNGVTVSTPAIKADQYIPAAAENPAALNTLLATIASGNDIVIRATGVNGRTLHWYLSGKYKVITSDGK